MLALLSIAAQSMTAQWGSWNHHGCTDSTAVNYDPAATVDDGSCFYGDPTWNNGQSDLDSLFDNGGPFPGNGDGPDSDETGNNNADSTDLGIDHGGWDPDSVWNSGPDGWDPDSSADHHPGDNYYDDDSSFVDNSPNDSLWGDPHWPPFDSISWTIDTLHFHFPEDSIQWNFPGDSIWVWPTPGDTIYGGGPLDSGWVFPYPGDTIYNGGSVDSVWVFPFPGDSGWVNPDDTSFHSGFHWDHPHLNIMGDDSIPAHFGFDGDFDHFEDGDGPVADSLGVYHGSGFANPNERMFGTSDALQITNVYPNPTLDNSRLVVQSSKDGMAMVRIFNLSGELVGSQQMVCVAGINQMQIDVTGLSSGTYLIQVNQGGQQKVVNLVKQ